MAKRYLLWFAHEHVDFRNAEIQSLLQLFNIEMKFVEEPQADILYWIVELDSEESAKKLASRSISLRWCLELWGRAKCIEHLHQNLQQSLSQPKQSWTYIHHQDENYDSYACSRNDMEPYFNSKNSFKFTVETFCKHFSSQEKVQKIEDFSYMPFEGNVNLKNPDVEIMYLEYYGLDHNRIPEKPYDLFIGLFIAEGQRHLISKLSLKTRKFIGNTSMDPQLSLLMANQAQILNGDIVIDPFVGSGSLLVAAAVFGAYVWGADIDFLVIHARSKPTRVNKKVREKDESIKANMKQYGVHQQYLDVVVSDFSMPLWKDSMKFDAIITDPPYGIREATEKIGIDKENYTLSAEHLNNHIPSKIDYSLSQIYKDLLLFAAKHLSIGKRLVCWYPYYREDYSETKLPSHNCLRLVANSEQILSKITARRLLTFEKIQEPDSCDEMMSIESADLKVNRNNNTIDENMPETSEYGFRQKYFCQEKTRKERKAEKKTVQSID